MSSALSKRSHQGNQWETNSVDTRRIRATIKKRITRNNVMSPILQILKMRRVEDILQCDEKNLHLRKCVQSSERLMADESNAKRKIDMAFLHTHAFGYLTSTNGLRTAHISTHSTLLFGVAQKKGSRVVNLDHLSRELERAWNGLTRIICDAPSIP